MKENGTDASYVAVYNGDSLSFAMGEEMRFVTEQLGFNVSANYDDSQEDILYLAPNDEILNQIKQYILNIICDEDITKTDDEKNCCRINVIL